MKLKLNTATANDVNNPHSNRFTKGRNRDFRTIPFPPIVPRELQGEGSVWYMKLFEREKCLLLDVGSFQNLADAANKIIELERYELLEGYGAFVVSDGFFRYIMDETETEPQIAEHTPKNTSRSYLLRRMAH